MGHLTVDELHPPSNPSYPGSPFDSSGHCIYHPTVKLARLDNDNVDSTSWIVERKLCPKCSLNSIIHDTARKSNLSLGRSFLSSNSGRSSERPRWKSRYSYQTDSSVSVSVSCASLPYSFEEGFDGHYIDRKNDGSEIDDADSLSRYSRRGRDWNSFNGSYHSRDPRDIPFRTPKDPSIKSKSSSSRLARPMQGKRSLSPESNSSTIGTSTIPTADASTCSTITMDTALFGRSQRGPRHHRNDYKRPLSSGLDPVWETDSKERDPIQETQSHVSGDSNGKYHIPMQVNIPQGEEERIILLSNIPNHIGQDKDVKSIKSQRSKEGRSRKEDDPSARSNHEFKIRNTIKSSRRRSHSWDERDNQSDHPPPRSSRNRSTNHHRGDASYYSQPTLASRSHSVRSYSSHRLIRHDIDPYGYCSHHPNIKLMKPDERDKNYWCVVRKKCPECIREDCPAVFDGDRSVRSNFTQGTPFYDEGSAYSIESSKGSNFFMAPLQTPEEIEEEEDTRRLKRRLAARAYHFPGNTWCEDWFQYVSNTHTVLGLFFHHPLHPLKLQERLVILFGSIAIGLTISNLAYMHFIKIGLDIDEELFRVNLTWLGMQEVIITQLMITLWTLGSFVHTVFDLGLWHMKACTLCRYGGQIDDRIARWGRVVGLFIVVSVMAAASYAVLLRASIEYKGEGSEGSSVEEAIRNNEFYEINFHGKRSFRFLLGYLVEFLLAMFVYYPLAITVIFSGVLGCRGRIPILGGRPREIKKERNHAMNKRKMLKSANKGAEDYETSDVDSTSFRDDLDDHVA